MSTAEVVGTGTGTADQLTFEMALAEGDEVEVRWTNSFCFYRAIAKIVRVNKMSFRVVVTGRVGESGGEYLVGRMLAFPRCFDFRKWSVNNGVFPKSTS